MNIEIVSSYDALSDRAAAIMLAAIRSKPSLVLGLPTGRTPEGMYARVVATCTRQYHCFRDVTTFNLDEYAGIPPTHPGSYRVYMHEHLFHAIDIDAARTHIPRGDAADLAAECTRYEAAIREAGGIDLTFLGLGQNGHIGFNEPGTPFDARTRVIKLTESTRKANASLFEDGSVPDCAITMGIGTILESRAIVLLASGASKRAAVARLRSGDVDESFPASALWRHPNVTVICDEDAAA
jgi:glucosamine-6-phosphate deaminase